MTKVKTTTELLLPSASVTSVSLELDANITDEQYLEVGKKLALIETANQWWIGDWLNANRKEWGDLKTLCKEVGLKYGSASAYASVCDRAKKSSRCLELSFGHHEIVAVMEPPDQEKWLGMALDGEDGKKWTTGKLRAEIRRSRGNSADSLQGMYRVVYADPPWDYGNRGLDQYGHADRHYTSMTIDELCAMNVQGHVTDDAVLFLWVTSPLLDECWPIIEAWGFEYKTSFVWDKVRHNHGHYNSVRHEFLLICTRGSCTPEVSKLFDSVVSVERSSEHSEKPQEFYDIIETLYPSGNRIELFARKRRQGWASWGNEAHG